MSQQLKKSDLLFHKMSAQPIFDQEDFESPGRVRVAVYENEGDQVPLSAYFVLFLAVASVSLAMLIFALLVS